MLKSKPKKTIIFFMPLFGGGGGERVVSELYPRFKQDMECVIVCFESKNYYPYQGRLIALNLRPSKNLLGKAWNLLVGTYKFWRVLHKEKPAWVMSLGNLPSIINIICHNNPIVRVGNPLSEGSTMYRLLGKLLFPKAAKIIAVSKGLEQELIHTFHIPKGKIEMIYNPIDTRKIEQLSQESLDTEYQGVFQNRVLITVGSLVGQKGQWHLIRAFSQAHKRQADLKLVLLGEGELESRLKDLAKDLGIEDSVYFLGWQKNPFKFLVRSQLFVASSLWEGFGNALVEALACGLPVISTDCKAGPREILAPNTDQEAHTKDIEYGQYGVLVPVCAKTFPRAESPLSPNEAILEKAIMEILYNEKMRKSFARKASERAKDFDVQKIVPQYEALLNEIC